MARTIIAVPRRDGDRVRDMEWAFCRKRWATYFPEFPVYEGHHDDGPFNRSAGINRAAAAADLDGRWDYAVVIDSDIMIPRKQLMAALNRAKTTGKVTWAHRRWRGFHEESTLHVIKTRHDFGPDIDREDMDLHIERTTPLSWSCCIVIPRKVWDAMGGFDERFRGWGFEDMAFMSVVCGLYGHERIEGDVYHLWHPRSPERIVKGESASTASPEYVTNARLGRRYMVALRRDHGLHDRPGLPSTPEERERDIRNLKRDDARLGPVASRLGLPRWDSWWPTLEELRDGSIAFRGASVSTPVVTLVVRSGGTDEAWPDRRVYLRKTLASLAERVSGPIVQRVVYSDWSDPIRTEVDAIAEQFGFYVAGEGHHAYTASARRLWQYLAHRAKGEYVFLAEDDFVYLRDVDLDPMITVMRANPHLAQLALLRGAYYPRELEAGGILGWPEASFKRAGANGTSWLEHRNFWTMNPSLFRRSLTDVSWPARESSEKVFGDMIKRNPKSRFAFWGSGEPWIDHIGAKRAGDGY